MLLYSHWWWHYPSAATICSVIPLCAKLVIGMRIRETGDKSKDAMPLLWAALCRETFTTETELSSMPIPPKPG